MTLAPIPDRSPDGIVFFGTPSVSARCLETLIGSGVQVDLVVTGEPKRRGRGSHLTKTAVHDVAESHSIPVVHGLEQVVSAVDRRGGTWLGIVVAYGRIIPRSILTRMPLVNLHFSLLPRWRGAAPVERAILAGDEETGVCLMRIEEGLDEGDVFSRLVVPITEGDTADSLRDRLCDVGTHELVRLLNEGFPPPVAQSGQASYAHKIVKDELCIDWTNSVDTNSRLVRIGGAYTFFRGERVKVTQARRSKSFTPLGGWSPGGIRVFEGEVSVACGDGVLILVAIQPAGRSSMSALSWWNGVPSTLVSAGETVRFDR